MNAPVRRMKVMGMVLCLAGGLAIAPTTPSAAPAASSAEPEQPTGLPPIFPLADVKPGLVGLAWTVFSGTKPEPFKVRVVSVVQNFVPHQDVILVKAEDPRVEFSGIVQGMSGSPVYIDGKLMGAIAYAWSFSKSPLAGVTPIESMLGERTRPRRHNDDAVATMSPRTGVGSELLPVSIPLSVSGLSDGAMSLLTEDLRPFGIVPMRAGGGGGRRRAPGELAAKIEPGSAIGVQLIRGDMNASGMGTVTWVNGNTILAFGHPMFGSGEVSFPMVTGEVHTFIPSQATSFKLASPLIEVGTVVQDRPSGIMGDLSQQAVMMPVEVRVTAPGAPMRTFRAEVARNKRLTPSLVSAVVTSAIADTEPDVTEMAIRLDSRLVVHGMGQVVLNDQVFSPEGLSPRVLLTARGLRALAEILNNPFQPAVVDRYEVDVKIDFRSDVAEILAVSLPGDEVKAGDVLPLRVTLRPYAGQEYVETIPVTIPKLLAGQAVKVEVASGALVRPDVPRPESLRGYIANMAAFYTASSIVVSLSTPDDGASLRGRLIPNLPQSALDTLRPGNQTRRADNYRVADRTVFPSSRPVVGRQELTVLVREDSLGRNR